MNKKITIGSTEEFSEIHKGRVKPIAKSGHIPFLKRFVGRIVNILIPKPEKCYWFLTTKELDLLKKEIDKIKIPDNKPYWKQEEETIKKAIDNIIKSPKEFLLDDLREVVYGIENIKSSKEIRDIIEKIKDFYSL